MKKNRKGFTLAELLIVVAIIGVLVAISIPIFNKQIERSREAYDIATMRQAASAATDIYYSDYKALLAAKKLGESGTPTAANYNIYGTYNPRTGSFVALKRELPEDLKAYGKGTEVNGGTAFVLGNTNGAYVAGADYRNAVVQIAIYPNASPARMDVFWKNNLVNNNYVGGQAPGGNAPRHCISIVLN